MWRVPKSCTFLLALGAAHIASNAPGSTPALADDIPDGFVYLRNIDPSIQQDMRYAGKLNFTRAPVPGYEAPECILEMETAKALSAVNQTLAQENMGLIIYDCYRPARAVRHFVSWVQNGGQRIDPKYFPRTARSILIKKGYIASKSGHSTGSSIDLGLIRLNIDGEYQLLDMGGIFDLFDTISHTDSKRVSATAQANRALLVAAMERENFENYYREWWHFSFRNARFAGKQFDFVVTQLK